jgi:hypothetical protein
VVSLTPANIARALLVAVAGFAIALGISLLEREQAGAIDTTSVGQVSAVTNSLLDGAAVPPVPTQSTAAPTFDPVRTVTRVAESALVAPVLETVAPVVRPVVDTVTPVLRPVVDTLAPVIAPVVDLAPPVAVPPVVSPAVVTPADALRRVLPKIAPGAAGDLPTPAPAPSAASLAAPGVYVAREVVAHASELVDTVASLGDLVSSHVPPPSLPQLPSPASAPNAPAGPLFAGGLAVLAAAAVMASARGQRFRCTTVRWQSAFFSSLIERPG